MDHALKLFDQIPELKSVFLWNTMIKGYSRIDSPKHGISVYLNMLRQNVKPDNYTFPFLLKGFHRNVGFSCGKQLHCHVVNFGLCSIVFVQNALIHMYSLCGQREMARRLFDISRKTDAITWNVIITGYNRMKRYDETCKLFDEMEKNGVVPSSVTLVSLLSGMF
ncbi:Detected protein of unknown function [Hibiscus syriacus]|uniref:Pentatricopeptide repeat-containing protein n=1 Tax=Hibiscus syriacus TaxID=106335 RepID=A0A6A2WBE9_HIBSY|nr:Detected protein of unknown function [Hibiscus syriacus]